METGKILGKEFIVLVFAFAPESLTLFQQFVFKIQKIFSETTASCFLENHSAFVLSQRVSDF